MNQVAHTSSAFAQDLEDLNMVVVRLGMLASRQLNACLRAMSDFQANRVDMLIERDVELDELEAEVNERVLNIITMRAPRAEDLRRVLAAAKAAQSLERIGDYARNTAKRTKAIMASEAGDLPWDQLIEIGTMVAAMIDDVIVAHQQGDLDAAQAIRNSDVHVDKLHTAFFGGVIAAMEEGDVPPLVGAHLLFIGKNLERIGDFTTSLAEQVLFIETGETVETSRPKADRTSWMIDEA
ncbi:MAG: phosphate transport system regulatory protein PhoU [SAR116 cluster bacterium]|jgi:phosphate transport system protein|nr:phosphate transport system regulatory protein PhoU [SAR116 cluster bacterium]RPG99601.1 MAG: phosphate signaling complex protein PhoU [Candidatus Puniceispirillum sp. TMED176]RZO30522.1 MAG: phosphate signaling complex protein PhoU [SAR116 cluster bacterium]|tara:strand:+ start:8515 stop:9228 length:714 start_codon:yes stop_codon:yes gene_type:complete